MAGRMVGRSVVRRFLAYLVLRRLFHVCFLATLVLRWFLRVRTAGSTARQRMF